MNLKTKLIALTAASLCATAAMAQPTYSPNPNKAQNSNMRTQSGGEPYANMYPTGRDLFLTPMDVYYITPDAVYVAPSEVYVITPQSDAALGAPTASSRDLPNRPTYTPNPNKVQNNGVPTQR